MKKLEAVIFDLDGVITDTAEYHFIAWEKISNELGIEIDRQFNERLKGVSRIESLNRILEFGGIADDLEEAEKHFYAEKKNDIYKELIQEITSDDLLPGIAELLEKLRVAGMKIGLASASKNAASVISNLQINDYFDVIVDGTHVKNSKPDPEVFLKAADQLGVAARNCVGIEDAEAGVESIKRAGMFAIGIGSEGELGLADMVLSSTEELTVERVLGVFG